MANDVSTLSRKPMTVGYASEKKPIMVGGRRDFFTYRDLGVRDASNRMMRGR